MNKEQRWALKYEGRDGQVKVCYPRSEAKKDEQLRVCREHGIRVISCRKLYPFSTMKNQHNFDLIHTLVMIDLYDIWSGDKKVSDAEYSRLEDLRDKSERFFSLELPVAWLEWEDWKEAHELSQMAILHRQEACIANGRPDLVTYC